ncbi:PREDICTED: C-type lectin mannose-binding isoform-like [Acropora digitifera]|uniref:C-type lectin mannose-binding isoform-like n=1 Tax=Acropora digitifera TaxID=70779 RepID=UPI00077AF87D|nr:PREDICTED: C-type lectin mannose-binding isoform-like [Acropora digitifera]
MQPRKDWVAANQHCGTFKTPCGGNGRLISIFSQDDNHRIGSLKSLRDLRKGAYYIGLNDLNETGTYKWSDGTAASFTNWNHGHPKGGKGGVVINFKMWRGSDYGKWEKLNYSKPERFICECPEGSCD